MYVFTVGLAVIQQYWRTAVIQTAQLISPTELIVYCLIKLNIELN